MLQNHGNEECSKVAPSSPLRLLKFRTGARPAFKTRLRHYSPRRGNPPQGEAVVLLAFRNCRRRVGGEFWEFPKTRRGGGRERAPSEEENEARVRESTHTNNAFNRRLQISAE